LVELAKDRDHPVDGEALELRTSDARKFSCTNASQALRRTDAQLAIIKNGDDLCRQDGPCLRPVSVRLAEIAKDIATAGNQFYLAHSNNSNQPIFLPGLYTVAAARAGGLARGSFDGTSGTFSST
jgi:hypothetical protein